MREGEPAVLKSDPIQLEMMIQRFRSVAEEMGYALQRTGYTAFVNETADLGVALVTPGGEIFGYPHSIGITMFSNLDFSEVLDGLGALAAGDIVICNDPYSTGGLSSHLPDISLILPIFVEDRLVCYAYAYVHSTDVGGKVAGSLSPSSYEIYQEGIRIPPTKLYRAGVLNEEVLALILANCRVPKDNWGDLRAMVTALRVGERRVLEIVARGGLDAFVDAMEDVITYSERRARRAIEGIPDGTYRFSDYLDDDVATEIPIKFCVALTVSGGDIHIDFTGTDPQVRSAFNLYSRGRPHPWLVYKVGFLLLTLEPDIPVNAGLLRPVRITTPEGSIVNCAAPAAVGLRTTTGVRLQDAICGALASAVPGIMPAAGAGYIAPVVMAEPNTEEGGVRVNVLEPMVGGTGASSAGDGLSARDVVDIANLRNSPLEIVEGNASVLVHRYGLRPDSGGPGRHRGGLGLILDFEITTASCLITARGQERHRFRPWGLAGGRYAEKAGVFLKRAGEDQFHAINKIDSLDLAFGDRVRVATPGGGGFGDPFERDPQSVLDDVIDGLVGIESARSDYGVAIREKSVDEAETEVLRRRDRSGGSGVDLFSVGPERIEYERLWTPEVWAAYSGLLYELAPAERSGARVRLWRALEAERDAGRIVSADDVHNRWRMISGAANRVKRQDSRPDPADSVGARTAAAGE